MGDDGLNYDSDYGDTDSEGDYVGDDEEIVTHQEEPDISHKVSGHWFQAAAFFFPEPRFALYANRGALLFLCVILETINSKPECRRPNLVM